MKKTIVTVALCLALICCFSACSLVPAVTAQQLSEAKDEIAKIAVEEPSAEPEEEVLEAEPAPEPEEGYTTFELRGLTIYYPETFVMEDEFGVTNIYCLDEDEAIVGLVTINAQALGGLAQEGMLEQDEYADGVAIGLEQSYDSFTVTDSKMTTFAGQKAHCLSYEFTTEGVSALADIYSFIGKGVLFTINYTYFPGFEKEIEPVFEDISNRLHLAA